MHPHDPTSKILAIAHHLNVHLHKESVTETFTTFLHIPRLIGGAYPVCPYPPIKIKHTRFLARLCHALYPTVISHRLCVNLSYLLNVVTQWHAHHDVTCHPAS